MDLQVHCWFSRWDVPLEKALRPSTSSDEELYGLKRGPKAPPGHEAPKKQEGLCILVESSSVCLGREMALS